MRADQKTCLTCAKPLTPLQALTGSLCGSAACAWKYKTVPERERCDVCGRVLTTAEFARQTCSSEACNRVSLVDRPIARKRTRFQRLQASLSAWRDECAGTIDIKDASSFTVTLVPHNVARDCALPESRREALRDHLTSVTRKAIALLQVAAADGNAAHSASQSSSDLPSRSPWPEPPSHELSAVMGNACIACRGACCSAGGEHAYITTDTIIRYLAAHPDCTEEQIVQAYLSHLVSRTMDPGCIYQHVSGCVLPREMRAATCNHYYCDELRVFQNNQADNSRMHAFFVPIDHGHVEQGVFAAPNFVQIVRADNFRPPTTL